VHTKEDAGSTPKGTQGAHQRGCREHTKGDAGSTPKGMQGAHQRGRREHTKKDAGSTPKGTQGAHQKGCREHTKEDAGSTPKRCSLHLRRQFSQEVTMAQVRQRGGASQDGTSERGGMVVQAKKIKTSRPEPERQPRGPKRNTWGHRLA